MDLEGFVKHVVDDTNSKFSELKDDIKIINNKLGDLQAFKIQMLASARVTSFIVSMVCGAITLTASIITVLFLFKPKP